MNILYFNGLGTGETRKREQTAIDYIERYGHKVTHGHINWRSHMTLPELIRQKELQARRLLTQGKLAIVGSSAGESLAINVLANLPNITGAYVVGLCGRVRPGPIEWWDWRSLGAMAHMGTGQESKLFYDSVVECERNLANMKQGRLSHITKVYQFADFVVPRATMLDDRVNNIRVNGIGHGMGIAMGVVILPQILGRIEHPEEATF